MHTFEIELRYKILDSAQLPAFLSQFSLAGQKHDKDIYLDTAEAILYQRGIFIRIRNDTTLEIKFNRACLDNPGLSLQDYCEEYSFALPMQQQDLTRFNQLVTSLGLMPIMEPDFAQFKKINTIDTHYIVDKFRSSYKCDAFTLSLDEVKDLGMFLEIELMANSIERIAAIKQEMLCILNGLSLEPLRTGYGTLLLRQKNFEHYLRGRFILEEDKIHRSYAK